MSELMNPSTSYFFDEDEIKVCEILVDLPTLVYESECRRQFSSITWAKRRKRSALRSSSSTTNNTMTAAAVAPSPCPQPETKNIIKIKKNNKVEAAAAASPSTPLSFSPSESDENKSSKQQLLKSNSKKRTREEWLEIIDGLTQNRELLKGELETLRSKYYNLSAINLELKSKKQELSLCQKTEKPQLGMNGSWKFGFQLDQQHQIAMVTHHQHHHHHQQQQQQQQKFLKDQAAYASQINGKFQDPYGQRTPMRSSPPYNGMGLVNQMGPRGIPDLNVSAEETFGLGSSTSQPLDLSRVVLMDNSRIRAAAARRRRMMKIKEVKNQGRNQNHHGPLIF